MGTIDNLSGRPMSREADSSVSQYRLAGGRAFHEYDLETVRGVYEKSCGENGFVPRHVHRVYDRDISSVHTRVYEPRETSCDAIPIILFAHGGGWVMGNLETHDALCRELAVQTGLPVVAVDYRLAPEHKFPAAYEDVEAVFEALKHNQELDFDVEGIFVAGDSAGGQLAASLAVARSHEDEPMLWGQVLLYPVIDVHEISESYRTVHKGFPLVGDTMEWFRQLYLVDDLGRDDPRVSPASASLGQYICPAFVISVDLDPLSEDGLKYVRKLVMASAEVEFRHLRGVPHGIFTSARHYRQAAESVEAASRFVNRVCALHRAG